MSHRLSDSYDYVIAGGGSAGCVLAARLCEDPEVRVLLVEAGGKGRSLVTRMPAAAGLVYGNPHYDWMLRSVPQPALGGRRILFPRGKGLGGSSLMNGMIYIRGNPADYDRWRQMGLPGWGYADVLPYFRRAEGAAHREGDPYHGADGPLRLSPARNIDRLSALFVEACQQAGAPANGDFNGGRQTGAGRLDAKVAGGIRQSTVEAYLTPRPRNLTVLTGVPVLRVALEGNRAVGLVLPNRTVRAGRDVILSLGAFGSPQCLMLSGIGPADHLTAHGIAVAADLPGVGSNLFDHPNMPMQFAVERPEWSLARFQRLDRAVLMGLQWLLAKSGPGAAPFWSGLLFHALRDAKMPELEVFCTPMMVRPDSAEPRDFTIQNFLALGKTMIARGKMAEPGVQFDINLLRPRSSGTVRLASADPRAAPLIDPDYFADPTDFDDLVAGIRHMREVMAQPAFHGVAGAEVSPGPEAESDEDLRDAIRRFVTTGHHPVATCRMGPEGDPGAVLDAELRVRGIDGLRVVDCAAFPTQVSGNTGAPVIMLAEKAADMILGRAPLPAGVAGETPA